MNASDVMLRKIRGHLLRVGLALLCLPSLAVADEGLIAHWPLSVDVNDAVGKHKATAAGLWIGEDGPRGDLKATRFDGVTGSWIRVEAADDLRLGSGDFTVAAWIEVDAASDDVTGDIVNQYDAAQARGFHLAIVTNAAATSATANRRQVQFGIRAGYAESPWEDHGRPGEAMLIFALAVHDGALYAGTCESGADQTGHVFRFDGGTSWTDCGRLDGSNAVASLAEFDGHLYAATAKYRLRGSALPDSPNATPGGRVYRLIEPGMWEDCGRVGDIEAINSLVVYRGQLYASSLYSPGFYRYEGGTTWTNLGTAENKRVEALAVFNGAIFATSYDGAEIHRYTPEEGWKIVGRLPDNTQTYGFAVYEGSLYVGTWPTGCVWRYDGDDRWTNVGRLGEEKEVMASAVYNGHLYAGTLPLANVYRFDGPGRWTDVGRLDLTPDVTYRRVWSMAVYRGRLFAGLLPSGHVKSMAAGACATSDRELSPGWHHLAGVRRGGRLVLYVDAQPTAESAPFDPASYDLSTDAPLLMGRGRHDFFRGRLCDVRLYRRALTDDDVKRLAERD